MMELAGRTVWITGASSGIGRALAIAMAGEGAKLILSGRNREALDAAAAQCQGSTPLAFEATEIDALPDIVAQAESITGQIDLLVNNAGIAQQSWVRDTDFAVYRQLMEVDYFAPLRLSQLVLAAMLARGSGHIAFVTSLSGRFGSPTASGYCGAKFALTGFAEALRSEVASQGIAVSLIVPGFVQTAITGRALGPTGQPIGQSVYGDRGITADESAEIIIAGLKAGTREIPVGRGPEMAMLNMVRSDPEGLFDQMAAAGKHMAARMKRDRA